MIEQKPENKEQVFKQKLIEVTRKMMKQFETSPAVKATKIFEEFLQEEKYSLAGMDDNLRITIDSLKHVAEVNPEVSYYFRLKREQEMLSK